MRTFLLALCLCATSVQAGEPWSTRDKTIGAAALTLHVADWAQTRYITKHPGYWERNPILGEHPSASEVNRYFIATAVASYLLADWFSGDNRTVFLIGYAVIRAGYVYHNYSLGVRMEF